MSNDPQNGHRIPKSPEQQICFEKSDLTPIQRARDLDVSQSASPKSLIKSRFLIHSKLVKCNKALPGNAEPNSVFLLLLPIFLFLLFSRTWKLLSHLEIIPIILQRESLLCSRQTLGETAGSELHNFRAEKSHVWIIPGSPMLLANPSQQIPSLDSLVRLRFLVNLQLKELSLCWVQSPSQKSAPSRPERKPELLACFTRKMSDTQTSRFLIWTI